MRKFIVHDETILTNCLTFIRTMIECGKKPEVNVGEFQPKRSNEQNAKMWAMLHDLSEQVDWYGQKLTPENWKDVCTAALKQQEVVPGINGGFVVLGTSTRRMKVAEMADLITLIEAFGIEHGVHFHDRWAA